MTSWAVSKNLKTEAIRHVVSPGFGSAVLAPIVTHVFQSLGVPASIHHAGGEWFSLHLQPSVLLIESEHLKDHARHERDGRCLAEVGRTKKPLLSEHAGFHDLFVPICAEGKVMATIVTGPFLLSRPSGPQVLTRWRWLTGRQGHPTDPHFATYLSETLRTLVLDRGKERAFERLLVCLATLMSGTGPADSLASEADELRIELERARFVERAWKTVSEMLDERTSEAWRSEGSIADLMRVGLKRPPEAILVGLTVNQVASDPVDEAIRRDAFKRQCVALALSVGDTISGQVGDHGVVFLSAKKGQKNRRRQALLDISERVLKMARRDFGFAMHFGLSDAPAVIPLGTSYHAALAAAEVAAVQGIKLRVGETETRLDGESLRHLRAELGRDVEERPELLRARFDRYLEAAALRAGYRIDPIRVHLEIGFEKLAEPLLRSSAIDESSLEGMRHALDRAAAETRTVGELFAAYRGAVADLSSALQTPVVARHDRSLRRGIEYMRAHYTEALTRGKVARVAGLTPTYFSVLFKRHEGRTFEDSLRDMRVRRAQQLLGGGELSVTRVAELSGFRSPQYFSRVFRRAVGTTARVYRLRAAEQATRVTNKSTSKNSLKDKSRARSGR